MIRPQADNGGVPAHFVIVNTNLFTLMRLVGP